MVIIVLLIWNLLIWDTRNLWNVFQAGAFIDLHYRVKIPYFGFKEINTTLRSFSINMETLVDIPIISQEVIIFIRGISKSPLINEIHWWSDIRIFILTCTQLLYFSRLLHFNEHVHLLIVFLVVLSVIIFNVNVLYIQEVYINSIHNMIQLQIQFFIIPFCLMVFIIY